MEENQPGNDDTNPQASLKKAAHRLGVTEINNFDYRSLNSIRKLSKTLGCKEYDLMKSFCPIQSNSENSIFEIIKDDYEHLDLSNESPNDTKETIRTLGSSYNDDKPFLPQNDQKNLKTQSLNTNKLFKRFHSQKLLTKPLLEIKDSIKISKKILKESNQNSVYEPVKNKDDQTTKTFKRTINKKKLPPRLYLKAKQHLEAELLDKNKGMNHNHKECSLFDSPKREVLLIKDENYGFGFIAGSEKPLVIRFVSQDGPGKDKLLNGDEILSINDENVQFSSREYVINLIRQSTKELKLIVKQPTPKSNNSLLLTETKKAFKKNSTKNKVRFCFDEEKQKIEEATVPLEEKILPLTIQDTVISEEENSENIAPKDINTSPCNTSSDENPNLSLEPESMENTNSSSETPEPSSSTDDTSAPILKVYLENEGFKSFKYDQNTCVRDVLNCFKDKLSLNHIESYGLVIKFNDQECVSSFVLLEETHHLYKIKEKFGNGGEANFQCFLRFIFVPASYEYLIFNDQASFNYLYEQSHSDVLHERFGNELKYEMILHLATLSVLHDYVKNLDTEKAESPKSNFNKIEFFKLNDSKTDYSLDQYLPKSFLESNILKRNDLKKLLNQNLEWFLEKNFLNKTDIQLEYLKCMNELLQYSGRIFFVNLMNDMKETFIIIGSNYGIATFLDIKSKTLLNLAKFEAIENIRVSVESSNLIKVDIDLLDATLDEDIFQKTLTIGFSRDDYLQFLYLLQGYLRICVFPTKHRLCPIQEIKSNSSKNLNISVFLVKYPNTKTAIESKSNKTIYINKNSDSNSSKLSDFDKSDSETTPTTEKSLVESIASTKEEDTLEPDLSQEIHKNEIKLTITSSDTLEDCSSEKIETTSPTLDITELTKVPTIDDLNKASLLDMHESLPLVESCHFTDQSHQEVLEPNETEEEKVMKEFCGEINELENLLRMANQKIKSLSSEQFESEKSSHCNKKEEDSDSISSIEGSLKCNAQSKDSTCSSTPLIHLYPKLEILSESSAKTTASEDTLKNVLGSDEDTSENTESIRLFPSSTLICTKTTQLVNNQIKSIENFVFSYNPDQGDKTESCEKINNQCDDEKVAAAADQATNNQMLKTSFNRGSIDPPRATKSKESEIDVIDLTQVQNKSSLITPPPVQFSDNFQNNEFKSNEVEIESGIESDSSNADQQIAETTKDSNHKPALLESSEVLSKADKQFLSKLFINLDTNNSNSRNLRESNSFNYGSIVPIIHSKFNNKTENKTDGAIKNILPSTFVSNKLLAKSFNNSQYVAPSANRVKSFVNAYSSKSIESTSAKKSSSFRSTQIVKPATESKQESTGSVSQMTDSGFMSSVNSFSDRNNSEQNNISSSSASSTPTSVSQVTNSNGPIVKTIAKSFETTNNTNNNLLPNYVKPKIFTSSVNKIFGNDENRSFKSVKDRFTRHSSSEIVLESFKYDTTQTTANTEENDSTEHRDEKPKGSIVSGIQNESSSNQSIVSQISPVSTNSESSLSSYSSLDSNYLNKIKQSTSSLGEEKKNVEASNTKQKTNFSPSGFHKVLNKLVETGIQVTKSKSHSDSLDQNKDDNYELIIGYEDTKTVPQKQNSKPKKRSYSYKSNSLTRLGRQHLFKINEFEVKKPNDAKSNDNLSKIVSEEKISNTQAQMPTKNVLNKPVRSKSYHNSLPSRNFKMVDDIRSLFDKLTSSKQNKTTHGSTSNINNASTSRAPINIHKETPENREKIKAPVLMQAPNRVETAKLKLSQSFQSSTDLNLNRKKLMYKQFETTSQLSSKSASTLKNNSFEPKKKNESLSSSFHESSTSLDNRRVIVLKSIKQIVSESDQNSPDSPRKGSLKKKGISRDSSLSRSPLKVRWKDMIEISKCVNSDSDSDTDPSLSEISNDIEVTKIGNESSKNNKNLISDNFHNDIIITTEKKNYVRRYEGIEHKFHLKPLHATGKEFEKEMMDRIGRLNKIKVKNVSEDEQNNDKFYDEIHVDLDVVLYELHSTIEHVRLSSMLDKFESVEDFDQKNAEISKMNQSKFEEKIADVAVICRHFVNNSKSMISSALVNEEEVKPHIRNAMNSLCSLVVECLETNYKYLYLNKKIDETRQLLIQILNLLNTFRTTLNITYLASSKQLNESNINLLMKQATNLANEISLLIKHFKQLF